VPTDWDEPARAHAVAAATESVGGARRARDLPEVKQFVELGYHLMDPDAVRLVLLTALWPPEHRTLGAGPHRAHGDEVAVGRLERHPAPR
jgi:hypothetical protein